MSKSVKIILLVMFILLCALGLFIYLYPKKALTLVVPDLKNIENLNVHFRSDTAYLNAGLRLENKSFLKLDIDSLIYYVNFDSATILAEPQFLGIVMDPWQTELVTLPLAIPHKRLMKKIQKLQAFDSTNLRIDLRVVYSTVFGHVAVPLSKKMRIEVPRPPKFEFVKMEFLNRRKNKVYLLAHVRMINRGKIQLNLSDIHYKFTVKDLINASGSGDKEISIKPHANMDFVFPITAEFTNVFKTLGMIISDRDRVNYQLRVTALAQNDKLGSEKMPVEMEQEGSMELKK